MKRTAMFRPVMTKQVNQTRQIEKMLVIRLRLMSSTRREELQKALTARSHSVARFAKCDIRQKWVSNSIMLWSIWFVSNTMYTMYWNWFIRLIRLNWFDWIELIFENYLSGEEVQVQGLWPEICHKKPNGKASCRAYGSSKSLVEQFKFQACNLIQFLFLFLPGREAI